MSKDRIHFVKGNKQDIEIEVPHISTICSYTNVKIKLYFIGGWNSDWHCKGQSYIGLVSKTLDKKKKNTKEQE